MICKLHYGALWAHYNFAADAPLVLLAARSHHHAVQIVEHLINNGGIDSRFPARRQHFILSGSQRLNTQLPESFANLCEFLAGGRIFTFQHIQIFSAGFFRNPVLDTRNRIDWQIFRVGVQHPVRGLTGATNDPLPRHIALGIRALIE